VFFAPKLVKAASLPIGLLWTFYFSDELTSIPTTLGKINTIVAPSNTYAQTYASTYDGAFTEFVAGDTDSDGVVNLNDYALIEANVIGVAQIDMLTAYYADANGDGAVDAFDLARIDREINS
jgi:hypothetical protein